MIKYISLVVIILPVSLFAMELELKSMGKQKPIIITEKNRAEITNVIDQAINNQFPQTVGSFFTKKTADHHLNILRIPETIRPPVIVDKSLIKALINKNKSFMNAIEFFSCIENITCDTLQLLDTSTEKQFPPHTRLPETIRLYIMKIIQDNTKFSYNITIKSPKEIKLCDICPRQHLAATYCGTNQVRIWDLKTGTLFGNIENVSNVAAIAFHPDNDHLFIGENTHRQITAYSLNSKQKVYEFNSCNSNKYDIEYIQLSKTTSHLVLMSVFMKNNGYDDETVLNQWIITPEEYLFAGIISKICRHYSAPTQIIRGCYQVKNPKHWTTLILNIEKHNCPTFNLCQQAIKSIASDDDIAKIKAYPEYKTLTILAKNILEHDIEEKALNIFY